MFLVDLLVFLVFLSFPFAGPMHVALGYFEVDAQQLQSRLSLLYNDRGTVRVINMWLISALIYLCGDFIEFLPSFLSTWERLAYAVFTLGNVGVCYGGILLVILSIRVILVRLYYIEHQVEDALDLSMPPGYQTFENNYVQSNSTAGAEEGEALNAGSDTGPINHRAQSQVWTEEYCLIRNVVHDFSENFGSQMLFGLFLFLCETTNMITFLWEEAGDKLGFRDMVALMLCFAVNAFLICAVFYSMAFLVVESSHHIGPKIIILAVRFEGETTGYQALALAFLHAPPKVHVGVFEVAPEYATAVFLWFLGLFLLVFGLKMPGAE